MEALSNVMLLRSIANNSTKEMNQEIIQKLEQAADNYRGGDDFEIWSAFHTGAQTILENPGEWGLTNDPYKDLILVEIIDGLKAENERYRKALEKITEESWSFERHHKIAKEALKQEEQ